MVKTFKQAFGVQVWFIPTIILHCYLLLAGDIYTNGSNLISFIFCLIWIFAASSFSPSIYESICDDVTSPVPTRQRLSSAGTKVHIFLCLILLVTVFTLCNK